jgi:hypothetical protein
LQRRTFAIDEDFATDLAFGSQEKLSSCIFSMGISDTIL